MYGSKTDEGTRDWRRLDNEELNNLYSYVVDLAFKSKTNCSEHVVRNKDTGIANIIFVKEKSSWKNVVCETKTAIVGYFTVKKVKEFVNMRELSY
jgi:hypothetical protein